MNDNQRLADAARESLEKANSHKNAPELGGPKTPKPNAKKRRRRVVAAARKANRG